MQQNKIPLRLYLEKWVAHNIFFAIALVACLLISIVTTLGFAVALAASVALVFSFFKHAEQMDDNLEIVLPIFTGFASAGACILLVIAGIGSMTLIGERTMVYSNNEIIQITAMVYIPMWIIIKLAGTDYTETGRRLRNWRNRIDQDIHAHQQNKD